MRPRPAKVSKPWAMPGTCIVGRERDWKSSPVGTAGGVFILHGVLSLYAWFSLPRSKLNENPSIGYASAERKGGEIYSLGRALLGGSGTEDAELLPRVLHKAAFYTEDLYTLHRGALRGGSFTRRSLYTGRTSHTESFTQRNFYTGKVLHTEAFAQRSLFTE